MNLSLPDAPAAWADLPFFAEDWPRLARATTDAPRRTLPPPPPAPPPVAMCME